MGFLSRLDDWLGEDESPFVCINCRAEFDRDYRECPQCGRPYVAPQDGDGDESTR
jgi:predicted amidophosphoribosyltransferase